MKGGAFYINHPWSASWHYSARHYIPSPLLPAANFLNITAGRCPRPTGLCGGCSGLTYDLHITDEELESDKIVEQHGVKVMVDKKSYIYLVGTELEFSDGLNGKGFVFTNPNATKTCGCGTSFGV